MAVDVDDGVIGPRHGMRGDDERGLRLVLTDAEVLRLRDRSRRARRSVRARAAGDARGASPADGRE